MSCTRARQNVTMADLDDIKVGSRLQKEKLLRTVRSTLQKEAQSDGAGEKGTGRKKPRRRRKPELTDPLEDDDEERGVSRGRGLDRANRVSKRPAQNGANRRGHAQSTSDDDRLAAAVQAATDAASDATNTSVEIEEAVQATALEFVQSARKKYGLDTVNSESDGDDSSSSHSSDTVITGTRGNRQKQQRSPKKGGVSKKAHEKKLSPDRDRDGSRAGNRGKPSARAPAGSPTRQRLFRSTASGLAATPSAPQRKPPARTAPRAQTGSWWRRDGGVGPSGAGPASSSSAPTAARSAGQASANNGAMGPPKRPATEWWRSGPSESGYETASRPAGRVLSQSSRDGIGSQPTRAPAVASVAPASNLATPLAAGSGWWSKSAGGQNATFDASLNSRMHRSMPLQATTSVSQTPRSASVSDRIPPSDDYYHRMLQHHPAVVNSARLSKIASALSSAEKALASMSHIHATPLSLQSRGSVALTGSSHVASTPYGAHAQALARSGSAVGYNPEGSATKALTSLYEQQKAASDANLNLATPARGTDGAIAAHEPSGNVPSAQGAAALHLSALSASALKLPQASALAELASAAQAPPLLINNPRHTTIPAPRPLRTVSVVPERPVPTSTRIPTRRPGPGQSARVRPSNGADQQTATPAALGSSHHTRPGQWIPPHMRGVQSARPEHHKSTPPSRRSFTRQQQPAAALHHSQQLVEEPEPQSSTVVTDKGASPPQASTPPRQSAVGAREGGNEGAGDTSKSTPTTTTSDPGPGVPLTLAELSRVANISPVVGEPDPNHNATGPGSPGINLDDTAPDSAEEPEATAQAQAQAQAQGSPPESTSPYYRGDESTLVAAASPPTQRYGGDESTIIAGASPSMQYDGDESTLVPENKAPVGHEPERDNGDKEDNEALKMPHAEPAKVRCAVCVDEIFRSFPDFHGTFVQSCGVQDDNAHVVRADEPPAQESREVDLGDDNFGVCWSVRLCVCSVHTNAAHYEYIVCTCSDSVRRSVATCRHH